jgi:hypothetical protein
MSVRTWTCGGSIVIVPCSVIGKIFLVCWFTLAGQATN